MNELTVYNNCYVILTTYMLNSSPEPSFNLFDKSFITAMDTEIDIRYVK